MIWTMPSTTLSVSILNSTLTYDPLFGRTRLLACHDDTLRELRPPAKIYPPDCFRKGFLRTTSPKRRSLRSSRPWVSALQSPGNLP